MKSLSKLFLVVLVSLIATEAHAMRWYSPNTGRWLSRDPIGERGGRNLMVFVGNDSINRMDPDGLNEVIVSGGCNANRHGWDIVGPTLGVEWPGSVLELPARGARALGADVAHDRNWKNFISAAEAEIIRRKEKLKGGEKIEWVVEINSYVARSEADGLGSMSYVHRIQQIAEKHDVILRWFGSKQGFASSINTSSTGEPRTGISKISRFTYYGHGTKGHLDFHYYDAVQPSKDSQSLTREDIKSGLLLKDAFMNNAIGISCGCNTATQADDKKGSLSDVWKAYLVLNSMEQTVA